MKTQKADLLQTFPNPKPTRDYLIKIEIPEFTCLCPATSQPDFAVIVLTYFPNNRCVELKSLKQYIASFREVGCYHEDVTNKILDDLVSLLEPKHMEINAKFNVRGGTYPTIRCIHSHENWPKKSITEYLNNSIDIN
ncbi:MAG: preQ(1) synthase [Pseudomonadota bacterium]|nr:preQ(1) synthase [Pseudomonadota bacterium]